MMKYKKNENWERNFKFESSLLVIGYSVFILKS
ncbi:hypothetical protein BMS3Abin05_00566 [bacterium BMS3Abin05]|nr:hypothetical protein BMS3Abin05_00566 [bacterium BMS3Abin05]GBE28784.1 hypothetical protein BMS3Bbin03_02735 [bacterium BMS3Bbin03]